MTAGEKINAYDQAKSAYESAVAGLIDAIKGSGGYLIKEGVAPYQVYGVDADGNVTIRPGFPSGATLPETPANPR